LGLSVGTGLALELPLLIMALGVFDVSAFTSFLAVIGFCGLDGFDVTGLGVSVLGRSNFSFHSAVKALVQPSNGAGTVDDVSCSKTRNTYVEYRKAGYSKKFKALHETDIILHQAAKKYFDELGYDKEKKLPTVASFRAEYATMLDEKKKAYREYRQTKSEMQSLLTARTNVQRLLNITERSEREHKKPTL